jgi:phosphonate transport system permease protein
MQPEAQPRLNRRNVGLAFLLIAAALLPFADIATGDHDPWTLLGRALAGFLSPSFAAIPGLWTAILLTVSFALLGVAIGAAAGFLLALAWGNRAVRIFSASVRSVHELFWALLLLQPFGPTALTGVLAIAIPYAGIFAKVFAEMLEEADRRPADLLPDDVGAVSRAAYARLPLAAGAMWTYTLYRVECGLRSSAVLGFVGLPTLGFELDSFFRQGAYDAVAAVLIIYYLLVGTMRFWMRAPFAPFWLAIAAAAVWSAGALRFSSENVVRFLTEDIVPAPLRGADLFAAETWSALADWLALLLVDQAAPGLFATVVVTQLALVVAGLIALAAFPLLVRSVVGRLGQGAGHWLLVVLRSTPEYMLAYFALQIFGPSMLPAVIALGLHNGAIIAHLLGREAERTTQLLRADAPRGFGLYTYELLPRMYGPFLAYGFYRWEIIMRESAIIGILGVATLGFYIDSAIGEIRVDRALVLIAVTALATIAIDAASRAIRGRLGLGAFGGVEATRFPARR